MKMETNVLYSRGHETSRKHASSQSSDGLNYNTSLAYAREVKKYKDLQLTKVLPIVFKSIDYCSRTHITTKYICICKC